MAATTRNDIKIECDSETGHYYIVWKPLVIAEGKTKRETLEDLRAAAHFGVDTLIDLKLKNIIRED